MFEYLPREKDATGLSDTLKNDFLCVSYSFALILPIVCAPSLSNEAVLMSALDCSYVGWRFYLHEPPGTNNAFTHHPDIPPEVLHREQELEEPEPEVNPWACLILRAVTRVLMGVTAEFVRQPLLSSSFMIHDFCANVSIGKCYIRQSAFRRAIKD